MPASTPLDGPGARVSEEHFRLLVDRVQDYAIFILDVEGHVATWNAGAERIKGYRPEAIIGQHFSVFYPPQDVAAGKPDRELEIVAAEGRLEDEDWRVREDGTLFWANVVITALHDSDGTLRGYGKITRDLTDRRRAEERRASEENFRLLVDGVQDYAIFTLDVEGHVATWNAGAERIKGHRPEAIIGQHCSVFYPPQDVAAGKPDRELSIVAAEGRLEDEDWRVREDGTPFWANVIMTALHDSDGTLRGYGEICRDLTDRRRAEEALRRTNSELADYAYTVSHDLAEPLRAIRGFAELLQKRYTGRFDAQADRWIDHVVAGAGRMQDLLAGLVSYTRPGVAAEPHTAFDCANVVEGTISMLAETIRDEEATVRTGPLPTSLIGAPDDLGRVFQNLVANAIKFHRSGVAPVVTITAQRGPGEWVFTVADNGIGIEPQHRDRIFKLFQRLHGPEEYPGTGVGLALSVKIVHRHEGRIWVEPEPQGGSLFRFTLPDPPPQ